MPGRAALRWSGQSQQRPSAAAPCRWTSLAHPVSYGRKGAGPGGDGWAPGPHRSFGLNPSTRYDEDFNHEPCQRKGHKAHWAVSTGGLLLLQSWALTLDLHDPHHQSLLSYPCTGTCPVPSRKGAGLGYPCPYKVLGKGLAGGSCLSVYHSGFPQTSSECGLFESVWTLLPVLPLPGSDSGLPRAYL